MIPKSSENKMAWQEGCYLVLEDTDEVSNAVGSSERAPPFEELLAPIFRS